VQANVSQPAAPPTVSLTLWQPLQTPRFVNVACPMNLNAPELAQKYSEGKNIHCGYLIVKEDRQEANSPEIRLAVAIVKSSSPHPAPDPLIMLQGGPGGALLKDFDFFVSAAGIKTAVGNRDTILIDQRGTGFSQPSLACHELFDLQDATMQQQLTIAQSTTEAVHAYQQCRQRLVNNHIDLNAYTTYNDANDVHDLIAALQLSQVNLYGVSYGTRLALEAMRSFPQYVRSVILDSTLPPELSFYNAIPHGYARVFQTLFQGCASDASCSQLHPNLASRFYSFIASADQHPLIMSLVNTDLGKVYPKAVMRGYDLFLGFWQMFYVTSWIPLMPRIMDEVIAGNYTNFARLYSALAFDTSVNVGMYESVICGEASGRASRDGIAQTSSELDPAVRSDVIQDTDGQAFDTCNVWSVRPVAQSEGQPVTSSIPTLVMEGEYDPVTPPSNGDEVAKSLAHSHVALFPATGHGTYLAGEACPVQVALNFLNTPSQQPDTSCIQTMAEPAFV
jgi:pimeloyl-ACP methyl ester carboxylesterase